MSNAQIINLKKHEAQDCIVIEYGHTKITMNYFQRRYNRNMPQFCTEISLNIDQAKMLVSSLQEAIIQLQAQQEEIEKFKREEMGKYND